MSKDKQQTHDGELHAVWIITHGGVTENEKKEKMVKLTQ